MLVVMVWLLSGALWWEGWGRLGAASSSPAAAQESPGEPGEIWSTSGRAQGNPKHLHYDTFPGEAGLQVSPCKPRLPSPRAP